MFLLANINICKAESDVQNGGMMQKRLLELVAFPGIRHMPAMRVPDRAHVRFVPGAALRTVKQPVYSWAE